MLINYSEYVNNDLEVAHPQSASSPTVPYRIGIWEKLAYLGKNHSEQTR